jgi:hypothetical protein
MKVLTGLAMSHGGFPPVAAGVELHTAFDNHEQEVRPVTLADQVELRREGLKIGRAHQHLELGVAHALEESKASHLGEVRGAHCRSLDKCQAYD